MAGGGLEVAADALHVAARRMQGNGSPGRCSGRSQGRSNCGLERRRFLGCSGFGGCLAFGSDRDENLHQ